MEITYRTLPPPYGEDLGRLYISQELEFDGFETDGAFYSAGAFYGTTLVGGVTLSRRHDLTVFDYIAVLPAYRKSGVGRNLAAMALEKVRGEGVCEVFLVTKAEGFFSKLGAEKLDRHDTLMNECLGCPRFDTACRPVPMRIRI